MIGLPTTTSAVFDSSVVMLVATHEQLLMKDAVGSLSRRPESRPRAIAGRNRGGRRNLGLLQPALWGVP